MLALLTLKYIRSATRFDRYLELFEAREEFFLFSKESIANTLGSFSRSHLVFVGSSSQISLSVLN